MKRKLLSLLLVVMMVFPVSLLMGCASDTFEVSGVVYSIKGDGVEETRVLMEDLSSESIIKQLEDVDVIGKNTSVNKFENSIKDNLHVISLDLGGGFKRTFEDADAQHRQLIIKCIANSFIVNYSVNGVIITCDGNTITDGVIQYTEPLVFNTDTVPPIETMDPSETELLSNENLVTTEAEPETEPESGSGFKKEPGQKYIAMSFDDGPSGTYTKMLVDKMNEYGAHASFFIVANRINDNTAEAMRYAVENGNEIEIHGYTHDVSYSTCDDDTYHYEVYETAKAIEETVGVYPTLMRPFGGNITPQRVHDSEFPVIIWDIDSEDWRHKKDGNIQAIINNVMSNLHDGGIILMHEIYDNSYTAFCTIIQKIYDQGYQMITVSDMLGANPRKGVKIYSPTHFVDPMANSDSE